MEALAGGAPLEAHALEIKAAGPPEPRPLAVIRSGPLVERLQLLIRAILFEVLATHLATRRAFDERRHDIAARGLGVDEPAESDRPDRAVRCLVRDREVGAGEAGRQRFFAIAGQFVGKLRRGRCLGPPP